MRTLEVYVKPENIASGNFCLTQRHFDYIYKYPECYIRLRNKDTKEIIREPFPAHKRHLLFEDRNGYFKCYKAPKEIAKQIVEPKVDYHEDKRPTRLLNTKEVAKALGIPAQIVSTAHQLGYLEPDVVEAKEKLYKYSKVEDFARKHAKHLEAIRSRMGSRHGRSSKSTDY